LSNLTEMTFSATLESGTWEREILEAESFFDDAQEAGAVNKVEGFFLLWEETTSDLSSIFDSLEGLLAGQSVLLN
jgi:hypothetical protein